MKEATLVCKARFKDDRVLETLTKKAQEHFTAMLKTASVELKIEGRGKAGERSDGQVILGRTLSTTDVRCAILGRI